MKKLLILLLIIFLGYSFAFLFVGKSKNYNFIPKKSNFSINKITQDLKNFTKNINKKKVSTADSLIAVNFFNKGIEYYNSENYSDAALSFSKAIQKNPYFTDAIFWNAKAEYSQKNYSIAEEKLNQLLDLDENYDSAYFYLGELNYEQSYYSDAIEYFSDFFTKHSASKESLDYIAWSYYYEDKSTDKAIAKEEQILEIDPNFADAHFALGFFFLIKAEDSDDTNEQTKYYKKSISQNLLCLKLAPKYKEAAYNTFFAYEQMNMQDSAVYYAKLAIKINKKYAKAYTALAETYFDKENYKKTLFYSNKAITLNDSSETAFYYRASSNYYLKKFLDAAKDFNQCYSITNKTSYILDEAESYLAADSIDKAIYYYSFYIDNTDINQKTKDSLLQKIQKLQDTNQ